MREALIPIDESERLRALQSYRVLDTPEEEAFDQLTELAASITGMPIALVSLVDDTRQWFKSRRGLDATETPRSVAFCAHAILDDHVFAVPDAHDDERFHDNPLVVDEVVRSYFGAPLRTPTGHNVGTLCVIDDQPRALTAEQQRSLQIIADQVVSQLELRRYVGICEEQIRLLDRRAAELEQFAYRTSHDLKSPALRIRAFAELALRELDGEADPAKLRARLEPIVRGADQMSELVEHIVDLTRADLDGHVVADIDVGALVRSICADLADDAAEAGVTVTVRADDARPVPTEEVRIRQIVTNLVSNAVKYHDPAKPAPSVDVVVATDDGSLRIDVRDNGVGIPPEYHDRIFAMFERFHPDRAPGTGLGTTIVKKHVDHLGGTITVDSTPAGTTFVVTVPVRTDGAAS